MPMGRHQYLTTLLRAVRPREVDPFARGNAPGGSAYRRALDDLAAHAPGTVDSPADLPASIARLLAVRRAWRAAETLPAGFSGTSDGENE